MNKRIFLLLIIFGLISGCSKEKMASNSSEKLYTLSLDQIKSSLKGSWDVRTKCYITIAGSNCQDIKNESLIFSDTDSLFWIENNEVIKKDKIEFIRVKAPDGYGYETDSLYLFKFAKDGDNNAYFPQAIMHDSLFVGGAIWAPDAGFGMTLTKSK